MTDQSPLARVGKRARYLATTALAVSMFAVAPAAQAQIMFDFDFSGNTAGVGFLDATNGAARQAALVEGGMRFSAMFAQHFTNSATIKMAVTSIENPASGTLASAGSAGFIYGGDPIIKEVVKQKLLGFADDNGTDADGSVDFNFGWNWQLDPDVAASPTEFDFFAALNHEFTHALGFSSAIDVAGNATVWNMFDTFLQDKNGARVIQGGSFQQSVWDATKTGGDVDGLFFGGANALGSNGGNGLGIYTPGTWQGGSSGSHLDTENGMFFGSMMKHNRDFGFEPREYNGFEVGILADLGYSRVVTSTVPEPSSLILMLTGLGFVGVAVRRRKA